MLLSPAGGEESLNIRDLGSQLTSNSTIARAQQMRREMEVLLARASKRFANSEGERSKLPELNFESSRQRSSSPIKNSRDSAYDGEDGARADWVLESRAESSDGDTDAGESSTAAVLRRARRMKQRATLALQSSRGASNSPPPASLTQQQPVSHGDTGEPAHLLHQERNSPQGEPIATTLPGATSGRAWHPSLASTPETRSGPALRTPPGVTPDGKVARERVAVAQTQSLGADAAAVESVLGAHSAASSPGGADDTARFFGAWAPREDRPQGAVCATGVPLQSERVTTPDPQTGQESAPKEGLGWAATGVERVKRLEDGAPVWTSEGGGRLAESALLQEEASKQLEMVDALLLGNAGAREGVALPATPPPVRDVGALCEPVEASPVDSLLATPARPARLYRPSPGQPLQGQLWHKGNPGVPAASRPQTTVSAERPAEAEPSPPREGGTVGVEVERWRADQLRSLASACRKEGSAAVAAANKAADTVERCRRLCEAAGATQRGRVSSLAGDARRAGGELAKVELLAARSRGHATKAVEAAAEVSALVSQIEAGIGIANLGAAARVDPARVDPARVDPSGRQPSPPKQEGMDRAEHAWGAFDRTGADVVARSLASQTAAQAALRRYMDDAAGRARPVQAPAGRVPETRPPPAGRAAGAAGGTRGASVGVEGQSRVLHVAGVRTSRESTVASAGRGRPRTALATGRGRAAEMEQLESARAARERKIQEIRRMLGGVRAA